MTCKNCGASLSPGVRFCSKCGTPSGRPSGEDVRARIRGSNDQPSVRRAPARSASPAQSSGILPLVGTGLFLLQILFLFLKGAVITPDFLSDKPTGYSLFSGSAFLGILVLLCCLGGAICTVLPLIGSETPMTKRAVQLLPAAALVLGILLLIVCVNAHTTKDPFITGATISKASVGLIGILFLILSAASTAAAFLSGKGAAPAPSRSTAPRHNASSQRTPSRQQYDSRQAAPQQAPSVPDAETIAKLRQIAQMHQQGMISDEEFAKVKAECVARGWIRG